jgi:hypothetical protein
VILPLTEPAASRCNTCFTKWGVLKIWSDNESVHWERRQRHRYVDDRSTTLLHQHLATVDKFAEQARR